MYQIVYSKDRKCPYDSILFEMFVQKQSTKNMEAYVVLYNGEIPSFAGSANVWPMEYHFVNGNCYQQSINV